MKAVNIGQRMAKLDQSEQSGIFLFFRYVFIIIAEQSGCDCVTQTLSRFWVSCAVLSEHILIYFINADNCVCLTIRGNFISVHLVCVCLCVSVSEFVYFDDTSVWAAVGVCGVTQAAPGECDFKCRMFMCVCLSTLCIQALHWWSLWKSIRGSVQLRRQCLCCRWNRSNAVRLRAACSTVS